ncbi:Type-4 uracil-DNA glycosylase [Burkholderiales bacterium]|nr:MAG: uracil-DNA glycosylase [Burkholderiales bacterium]CAG0997450.1 Type-4 uracil-DNA glycosylase [Burkholderiales bacterium]
MDRQQEILRELGLLPLWRRRDRVSEKRADDASAAPSNDGAVFSREAQINTLSWEALPQHVAACRACGLCDSRQQAVPGVGQATATWLVVGEAPGAEEDRQGEPFVGQAGKLLDNMLAAIGLKRGEAVFIANVLKCRPPGNRNPAPEEVAACRPYLERQIMLLRPKLILALGRFAALTLLDTDASIASLRGRVHQRQGFPLVVTYHPAYLLRNLPDKAKAWEDLCLAREAYRNLSGESGAPT